MLEDGPAQGIIDQRGGPALGVDDLGLLISGIKDRRGLARLVILHQGPPARGVIGVSDTLARGHDLACKDLACDRANI